MLNYRVTRDESENVVRMLCDNYPKCFFDNPRHRRPLKKDIAMDVIKDKNFDVEPELIHAGIDWYKSHIGYHIVCSTPGTKRVDLNGKIVGTISESEAIAAQQEVESINRSKLRPKPLVKSSSTIADPVEVVNKLYADGRIPDDAVKKLDATPMPKSKTTPAPIAPAPIIPAASVAPGATEVAKIAPEFATVLETLNQASAAVLGITVPAMRLAVARATLDEVIKQAQQVKNELAK